MGSEIKPPIISRYLRLKKQVLDSSEPGLTFEGLIDAVLVLYEECNNEKIKDNENIRSFLEKFQPTVHSYHKLRINISDFDVKRVIGKGNFAEVKLAKEKSTGNVYALKVMKKNGGNNTAFYEEERDIMARATSPWLTKLDYAFQDASFLYLAMEFHQGGDLLGLMDKNDNLPETAIRFYIAEIALGIHDLHKMGFVHRDIKPENILIDRTGHLKLADFGNGARLSTSGTVSKVMPVGTPEYIAPEVLQCLQGKAGATNHGDECDYWSLGILAFEMQFGCTPFSDLNGSVIHTYSNIMDHKKHLSFPTNSNSDLNSLIQGLLLPAVQRSGHNSIIRHPFFGDIDWANMQNIAPPYVPTVSSLEDASNFDIVDESGPDSTSFQSLKPKKEFECKNLPYVGFTYTSDKGKAKSLEKGEHSSLAEELKAKVAEIERLKLKTFQLEQQVVNYSRVHDSSHRELEQVEKLSTQLNIAEKEILDLKSTIKNTERILEIERQDRSVTESKTIQLLQDVRKKWAKAEEERMEEVRQELNQVKEKAIKFETDYSIVVRENKAIKSEHEYLVSVKNQLKTKLKEYRQRLENIAKVESERNQSLGGLSIKLERIGIKNLVISKLEAEIKGLKTQLNGAHDALDETKYVEGKVDALQLIVEQRDQILAEKDAEIKIKVAEIEAYAVKYKQMKKKVVELEEQLKRKTNEIVKLNDELDEARTETAVHEQSAIGVHAQLKSELKATMTDNQELKNKNSELNITLEALNMQEKETKEKLINLGTENKELNNANGELKSENSRLRSTTEALNIKEKDYKEKLSSLEKVFDNLQKKIDVVQAEKSKKTEPDLVNFSKEIESLKKKNKTLEKTMAEVSDEVKQYEKNNLQLQAELKQKKLEFETLLKKNENLEKATTEVSDEFKLYEKDNAQLQAELREVKLDLRMATREVEKKASLNAYLREKEEKIKTAKEELEAKLVELEEGKKKSVSELEEAKQEIENHDKIKERFGKQVEDLNKLKDEKNGLNLENRRLKTDASSLEAKNGSLKRKINDMEKDKKKYVNLELNCEALKEVTAELENQVMDFEKMNERLQTKIDNLADTNRELTTKLEAASAEVRLAKVATNEEKSAKIFVERKVKDLTTKIEEFEEDLKKEQETHQKNVNEYKTLCKKLGDTLEDMTKDNSQKELFGISAERARAHLEIEINQLKEELTTKTTQLQSHKESNFKLSQGIEDAITKIQEKNKKMEELELKLETESRILSLKMLRQESTIAQQVKLIDFLQTKVSGLEGKKKTITEKIFGNNKENRPVSGIPVAYHELESILDKERSKSRKIGKQLDKARAEVVALKTSRGNDNIPQSVLNQLEGEKAEKGVAHNIPHRIHQAANKKSTRCPVCQETVGFMMMCSICRDCGLATHSNCAPSLPPTCGLSSQLLQAIQGRQGTDGIQGRPLPPAPAQGSRGREEGSVQTLQAGEWNDAWLTLTENNMLDIYQDSTKKTRIDQVALTAPHCRVSVQSTVSFGEVYYVTSSDRPYAFKLSVNTIGKPEKAIYFMSQNFEQKVDWVNRLEEVVKSAKSNLSPVQEPQHDAVSVVAVTPATVEVLSVCTLEDIFIMGTTQGLKTRNLNDENASVKQLSGLDSPVHQIVHLPELQLCVMATGEDVDVENSSQLVTVSTRAIQAGIPLTPQPVPEVTLCHIFAATATQAGSIYICAANQHHVTILEWSAARGQFVLRNKFSTDKHTTCIFFTEHSVLVGTTKFYEIDLKNFSAEEFLDTSDTGISKLVDSTEFHGSLPHCVLRVLHSQEPEYLLCFTRHVVFVDGFGQQVREAITFSRLPVEQRLLGRVLVTSFSDSLQLLTLDNDEETVPVETVLLWVPSPHLVGQHKKYVYYTTPDTASNNLVCLDVKKVKSSIAV